MQTAEPEPLLHDLKNIFVLSATVPTQTDALKAGRCETLRLPRAAMGCLYEKNRGKFIVSTQRLECIPIIARTSVGQFNALPLAYEPSPYYDPPLLHRQREIAS